VPQPIEVRPKDALATPIQPEPAKTVKEPEKPVPVVSPKVAKTREEKKPVAKPPVSPPPVEKPTFVTPKVMPAPAEIEVTLSAETKAHIEVDAKARVSFQIELTAEAMPLAVSLAVAAKSDVPIVVSLSAENDAIEIVSRHECRVDPPASGQPRAGFFTVKGVRPGVSRLAVAFRQGGSDLGVIGLVTEVVPPGARWQSLIRRFLLGEKAQGQAVAAPRDIADDDKLTLLVELRAENKHFFYEYTLHSEALGLEYRRMRSKPLLDSGGGPAATVLAFVERIYERVTQQLKTVDDLRQLQLEASALGASLCRELFDPEVATLLWPLRDRIKLVQIVSWEPYIPWELVRLRDPASDNIDDRFLCEYSLVRTLSDEMPVRALTMGRWAYLGATFPMGSYPAVGAELDYFTTKSLGSLRSRGISPESIAPTRDAFYAALAGGDFDVLHICCHAESPQKSIDRASLIISDQTPPGDTKARLVDVDTDTVELKARLRQRRPLVFLNACETGRVGAVLTAWGGWPNVFLRKGAGVFVGSAWAVRDKPAAAFSTSFYNALLDGKTLAEAASAGRAAAKELGDASWLAFKVYGHPRAQHKPN
jgi:CHAT domain